MPKSLFYLCLIILGAPTIVLANNFAPISNAQLFNPKEFQKSQAKFQQLNSLDFLLSKPSRVVVRKSPEKNKNGKNEEHKRRSE